MKNGREKIRHAAKIMAWLFMFLLLAAPGRSALADQFTVSYTTYDTTYEKIMKMYLKVINGYGTANYGRHDLFNDMIFGGMEEWDTKRLISEVKRNTGFMLYDVNQDGVDELLIGSSGGWLYEVFTVDQGRVRELIRAGGYGTASSEYSCALLASGMFYRHGHGGAGLDYYELWEMNGTDKVYFVDGYHTEYAWDADAQNGSEVWYRSGAPMNQPGASKTRVDAAVAKQWVKKQEWSIYAKKFVPFSVFEKYPEDPWNVAVLSVNGTYNTTAKVNIRKEASASSKLVATKNVGTYVKVLDKEGDFFRIAFGNKEGYVQQEYLTPLTYEIAAEDASDARSPGIGNSPETAAEEEDAQAGRDESSGSREPYPAAGKTGSANVNIRAEADKKSKLVATVRKKGTAVTVTGEAAGKDGAAWYSVEYNGKEGFVRSDFILLEETGRADAASGGELYGLVIKKLATRAGPSPRAEDTGTYSVKGQRLRVYSRAYDPIENAWWVKCDVPYHGQIRTLWAWYTRFDSKTLPLESIPIDEDY